MAEDHAEVARQHAEVAHGDDDMGCSLQHTDLHPGNILVRVRPSGKGAADAAPAALDDVLMKPIRHGQAKAQLQLV